MKKPKPYKVRCTTCSYVITASSYETAMHAAALHKAAHRHEVGL